MWHVWGALPASKDQRGTATAPAVPISVPERPPTPSRLIILRINSGCTYRQQPKGGVRSHCLYVSSQGGVLTQGGDVCVSV